MSGRLFSLGSILVDLPIAVPGLPPRGGAVLGEARPPAVGAGFNLVAAAARQGARCVYGGGHGTGPYGELVRAALRAEGITAALPPRPDGDSGFCVALVEPGEERAFVTAFGVEARLRPADLALLDPGPADVVAISGYDLAHPHTGPLLAEWVAGLPAGVGVALDPGPLVAGLTLLDALLPRLTVFSLNQREGRLFAGRVSGSGPELACAVAERVPASTLVVLREGAAGATAVGGPLRDPLTVPAPVVEVVDTTGAGDTHLGVLLAGLLRGAEVGEALRAATVAAAMSVTLRGSATAPTSAPPGAAHAARA